MDTSAVIDYEQLVATYWESLVTVLRGFRPAAEFLETWVPDEDPVKSILNLVEAAHMAGQDHIALSLGPVTLQVLNLSTLQELAADLGQVQVEAKGDHIIFVVSRLREWSTFQGIHPVYRKGVQTAFQMSRHEGPLVAESGLELIHTSYQGMTLMVLVDPADHVIRKASYHGADSALRRGLLEALCALLIGMTMQEASDHAGIYLEHQLRDHTQPPPVSGIVTPENADPVFQIPVQLVRALLARYRQVTGYDSIVNFYDRPPGPAWRALSTAEKLQRLQETINELCVDLSPPNPAIEIVGIADEVKVTIRFRHVLSSALKPLYLLQLEAGLQQKIDPKLQLYLEEMKDLNKIRRL